MFALLTLLGAPQASGSTWSSASLSGAFGSDAFVTAVLAEEELLGLQKAADAVFIHDGIVDYAVRLAAGTRSHPAGPPFSGQLPRRPPSRSARCSTGGCTPRRPGSSAR